MMSRFLLCLIFLCSFLLGKAQHFLYFESETPFYVKAGDKTFTSGSQGYILIPALEQKISTLWIGISAEGSPKGIYTIEPSSLDRGYELQVGQKGLELRDLNSKNILHSPVDDLQVSYESREDPFTMLLARAVNDPTLLRVPVAAVQREEVSKAVADVPAKEEVKKEEGIADNDTAAVAVISNNAVVEDKKEEKSEESSPKVDTILISPATPMEIIETYERSTVRRYSESSTSEGFGLVYIIKTGEVLDTVRLVIPNPRVTFNADAEKPDESLFLPLGKKELDSLNKSCVRAANDDFLSLRKEMASQVSEGLMIKAAEAVFSTRCFSVVQIRSLGALFLDMEQRYLFFEAAHKNVWDRPSFSSLSSELSGSDLLERFQKLISK